MDGEQLLDFQRRLLQEREKHNSRIDFLDEQDQSGLGVSMKDAVSELSTIDNHPADMGTEVFERSKDFALRENAMLAVEGIDRALQKINDGTYGICEVCGRDIAVARLKAVPSTNKCRDCKEAEEVIPRQNDRPVEEEVLSPPFARTFNDHTDAVVYDGEDAWQEVAHYSETTDEWSRGGSYYGYSDFDIERKGEVLDVDDIPYEKGDDGLYYKKFRGVDDEEAPQKV